MEHEPTVPSSLLILHNIRSAHNVGAIFRTGDAAGVSKILLSGYTPTPLDRFGAPRKDLAKVALGAERSVPWEQVKNLSSTLAQLKKENYMLVAIEQSPDSLSIFDWKPKQRTRPLALMLGNEVRGISAQLLRKVDHILEIPMRGSKESLNVSVAAGIALFTLLH